MSYNFQILDLVYKLNKDTSSFLFKISLLTTKTKNYEIRHT